MEKQKKKMPKWLIVLIVIIGIGFLGSLFSDDQPLKSESQKPVTVIDLSDMSIEDVANWCEEKNLNCYKKEEYSEIVVKGNFVKQSVESNKTIYEGDTINVFYSLGKEPTPSQKNALKSALSYLRSSAFSYESLINQLRYEEYSYEDAKYAVDNCGADWMEQAYKSGKSYLESSSFSLNSLIKQLKYEKFTDKQARYGAEKAYNEQ